MSASEKIGGFRYRILLMLIYATTVNYFDRSILGVLSPTLMELFEWTNSDYSKITIAFQIAYALGMLTMGGIIDKLGTRRGYVLSIATWSFFGLLHAAVRPAFSVLGFSVARFGLGFGESGHFPSAQKTVAEWFPKKERAFATGLYNAATSIGAIAAPFVVGAIVSKEGHNWQIPFLITGGLSAIWVFLWLRIYKKPEEHPKLSKKELEYIVSDSGIETKEKLPWAKVLPKRQTWAFALAKMTDAVWWFYLFWGAIFLHDKFGVDIKHIGVPFLIIYLLADVGSITGGWMSGFFMRRGWGLNKARKITLLICALVILPVSYVAWIDSSYLEYENLSEVEIASGEYQNIEGYAWHQNDEGDLVGKQDPEKSRNQWLAIILIGIAAAGHQAWSANLFTLVSDVFPKKAVASVTGIGGMMGAAAGVAAFYTLGKLLDASGNEGFFWAFLVAGTLYLILLGVAHLLMPKMVPLDENLKLTE